MKTAEVKVYGTEAEAVAARGDLESYAVKRGSQTFYVVARNADHARSSVSRHCADVCSPVGPERAADPMKALAKKLDKMSEAEIAALQTLLAQRKG